MLYLSVDNGLGPEPLRRVTHHEVFHQIDFADDGRLDRDPAWEALNQPGFRYHGDNQTLQADPEASRLGTEVVGFLNEYSTSSVGEDKAELYSYLMVDPAMVRHRAADDDILRGKAKQLHQILDCFQIPTRMLPEL